MTLYDVTNRKQFVYAETVFSTLLVLRLRVTRIHGAAACTSTHDSDVSLAETTCSQS